MSEVICVSYGPEEMDVVEKGIDAIRDVIYHGSYEESASLLFCLETYVDPWFGYADDPENQAFVDQIFVLLQEVILDPSLHIDKFEALHQIRCCSKPLTLFEEAMEKDITFLDTDIYGRKLYERIEDEVYLNKIWRAMGHEGTVVINDYSRNMEYNLNRMINDYSVEADPEKLAKWYARWLAVYGQEKWE